MSRKTKYCDEIGTPIIIGDLIEINTATAGYIGTVVFDRNFGCYALKVSSQRINKSPERWERERPVHDIFVSLEQFRKRFLWIRSRTLKGVKVIKRETARARRLAPHLA